MTQAGMTQAGIVLGVFVGGRGSRMGGRDKASLPAPASGEPLAQRLCRLGVEAGLSPLVVGASPHDAVIEGVAVERLTDAPPNIGPLGGLNALLTRAGDRRAIAVACDMPFVTVELLSRLAGDARDAAVVAPRDADSGKWEALCARYDSARVRPVLAQALADGVRSFQTLLSRLDVAELVLERGERGQLADWDSPDDVQG